MDCRILCQVLQLLNLLSRGPELGIRGVPVPSCWLSSGAHRSLLSSLSDLLLHLFRQLDALGFCPSPEDKHWRDALRETLESSLVLSVQLFRLSINSSSDRYLFPDIVEKMLFLSFLSNMPIQAAVSSGDMLAFLYGNKGCCTVYCGLKSVESHVLICVVVNT